MLVLEIVAGWCILSVPASLLMGAMLHRSRVQLATVAPPAPRPRPVKPAA